MAKNESRRERTVQETGSAERDVKDIAQQTKQHASRLADRGRERAVEELHKLARAVRDTGEHMGDGGGALGGVMNKVADQIERVSEVARSRNPRDVLDAVERFARRDRALFVGSAVMLGIFAARFLRSSAREEQRSGDIGRFDPALDRDIEPIAEEEIEETVIEVQPTAEIPGAVSGTAPPPMGGR